MKKYTVLTFNFNGYDKVREPSVVDADAEYICITDRSVNSDVWTCVVDSRLVNRNPIYSSYYVRYHPFEYARTDTVIVLDASIQVNDSLADIVDAFGSSEMSVMCTNYKDAAHKLDEWKLRPDRISKDDLDAVTDFLGSHIHEKGSTGSAFQMYRKCDAVLRFQERVWGAIVGIGMYGVPNRLDEIVFHRMLSDCGLDLFVTSIQIIQSSYMTYMKHRSDEPVAVYKNYDQMYYLNDRPVFPVRIDRKVHFQISYKYETEALLLTRYLDEKDLEEWLDHHLHGCGFEHVKVYDNDSGYDVEGVCRRFKNVDYELVRGQARQYLIYDRHFQESEAKWIMPIDDDEYLDIGDFGSVAEAIRYYEKKFPHMNMLAVRWKHLFPRSFQTERQGKVLDYCTEENPWLAEQFMHLGDRTVKTIVKNYGSIHYEETCENPSGGHVPRNSTFLGAVLFNGTNVQGCGISEVPKNTSDERLRLLHCRYKGKSDWARKAGEMTVSDSTPRVKSWKFDELLPSLA